MKKTYILNHFMLGIGLLLSVFSLHAQETGKLSGQIIDSNQQPVSQVEVSISKINRGTISNEEGYFGIENIPTGKYSIGISAVGYKATYEQVVIKPEQTTTATIRITEIPYELSTITIKGAGLKNRNQTATVNAISLDDIKKLNISTPQDLLYEVPGVERIDLGQGGAVSQVGIRGFELGGHGGDLAMEVDGISFNETEHSGGYVDMNIIIPINLSKVEVYKGPSSPLFGLFARGGAMSFVTRKGGEYTDLFLKGGSYDAVDAQAAIGHYFDMGNGKDLKTNFAIQSNRSDGYTDNSDYLKANINGRAAYDLSDKTEIAFSLIGHSSKWDAPGFITEDMLKDKRQRRYQAENGENDGGKQVFASERIELNHSFDDNLRLLVYAYSIQQSQTRFSKFGIEPGPGEQTDVTHSRKTYSTGANLNGRHSIANIETDWVGGIEFYNEFTDRTGWASFNRVRTDDTPYQDNAYRLQYLAFFGQGEFNISPYFRPSIGFRYETFDGRLVNRFDSSKSDLQSLNHFSPKLGFRSTLFTGFDFRVNISNGYSLPSGDTKYAHDEQVKPEKLWQYESGINYDYKNIVNVDISAYILKNSHEKTFVHGAEDLILNSGKTERKGVEIGLTAHPLKGLNLKGSFTYQHTKINDLPDSPDLEGNELTNLPHTIASLYADYTFNNGFGVKFGFRDAGKYATNRINTNYYSGYTVADAKLFYNLGKNSYRKGRIIFEVNNIFGENYATYALDFSNEFGIPGGVFYSPAPMRNFSVGISYSL